MEKISIKGIVVGALIDWVTSLTFMMPLTAYVMVSRRIMQLPREQVKAALNAAMHKDLRIFGIQLLIGIACSVIGSYVAGVLAKQAQILNGVLSAMLPSVTGIYSLFVGTYSQPLWLTLILIFVATPLAGMLGGYLALLQARRSAVPA